MTKFDTARIAFEIAAFLAAVVAAWKAQRARGAAVTAVETLHRLEISINGRMGELLKLTERAAHAEGVSQEQERPAERRAHTPPSKQKGA